MKQHGLNKDWHHMISLIEKGIHFGIFCIGAYWHFQLPVRQHGHDNNTTKVRQENMITKVWKEAAVISPTQRRSVLEPGPSSWWWAARTGRAEPGWARIRSAEISGPSRGSGPWWSTRSRRSTAGSTRRPTAGHTCGVISRKSFNSSLCSISLAPEWSVPTLNITARYSRI